MDLSPDLITANGGCGRKRSQNFTAAEKDCLLNAIYVLRHVIECRKTDAVTWKQKEQAWVEVADIFNSKSPNGIYRTARSLKNLYENMKKEQRKACAQNRLDLQKTGAGKNDQKTNVHEPLLMSIITKRPGCGMQDNFDSNATNGQDDNHGEDEFSSHNDATQEETITVKIEGADFPVVYDDEEVPPVDVSIHQSDTWDWNNGNDISISHSSTDPRTTDKPVNGNMTCRHKSVASTPPSASRLAKEYNELARLKMEIAEFTLQSLKEERAEKLQEHKLRMLSLELDIEIKKRKLNS